MSPDGAKYFKVDIAVRQKVETPTYRPTNTASEYDTIERMPQIASDPPEVCPVCETDYDSVTEHTDGLLVGLDDNERYRRVCFEPYGVDGQARIRFYHHTHQQAETTHP